MNLALSPSALGRNLPSPLIVLLLFVFGIAHTTEAENSPESAFHHLQIEAGSAYAQGLLIGRSLGPEISRRLDLWNELLQENLGQVDQGLIDNLDEETGLIDAIRHYTPELLQEVRSMADGADVPYARLLSYNLAEEIMTLAGQPSNRCTTVVMATETGHVVGYNLDLPDFLHGDQRPLILSQAQSVASSPGKLKVTD
ncbi:MAG: hypothetical protein AAGJ52_09795 [Pseudomonadota bacterium]